MATTQIVMGILSSPQDAESAVNNLTEEDFPGRSISVVARNEADARAIAHDAGPFKGIRNGELSNRLTNLGMSAGDAERYVDAVEAGHVLLALSAPISGRRQPRLIPASTRRTRWRTTCTTRCAAVE